MDNVTQQRIAKLHPKVRDEVSAIVNFIDDTLLLGRANMRIVQGLRTFDEQNALYAQGRTAPGKKVTQAKGGQSIHNYGLAIDFALVVDGQEVSWDVTKDWDGDKVPDWNEVVAEFEKHGWDWGGRWRTFKDLPHFEKPFGNTWKTLLAKKEAGKVDTQGYIII